MREDTAQPRRILMLSWEYPPRIVGGIARHVAELSRALADCGHVVDVLTAHHPGAPEEEEIACAGGGRLRVLRARPSPINPLDFVCDIHQLDFELLQRLLRAWGGEAQAPAGLSSARYDVIHGHDWLVGFAARTLRHGLGTPLVATIHATESGRQGGLHTPMQHYIHSVEWMLTYDAWRVICCSEAMSGEVIGSLRVPLDKVRVIPNGVDPERLRCADDPIQLKEFRRRWARDEERLIFFVGRLVREKGVEVLIDAMPEILKDGLRAKLVVAGGGWWGDLARRVRERGVDGRVVFAGFVSEDDLRRLYAIADVAVFPSLYEPFGIVALEAMAAGAPVVTSDVGGFREVVRHGETGIHTWANNSHSLAWGIRGVLLNPELANRLRRQGREEVQARYSWDGIAQLTVAVYEEALSLRDGRDMPALIPQAGPGARPRYVTAGALVRGGRREGAVWSKR